MLWSLESGDELPQDWVRKVIDVRIRVLSVCDPTRLDSDGDILMWSHYGEKHTGCRIHFQKDFLKRRATVHWDVEYSHSIPAISTDYIRDLDGGAREIEAFEALSLSLRSKGAFWSYEKEARFFFEKKKCKLDRVTSCYYLPIPFRAITRVDLGLHTPDAARRRIEKLLFSPQFEHVRLFEATRPRGKFAIDYIPCR